MAGQAMTIVQGLGIIKGGWSSWRDVLQFESNRL